MTATMGALSEVGRIRRLVVKHAAEAFGSPATIDAEWRDLNFTGAPVFSRALDEYDAFLDLLARAGAEILRLPAAPGVGLDSIYVRDAAVLGPAGVILGSMGKAQRAAEPAVQAQALGQWGLPIAGAIRPPGRLEGGDVVWLDTRLVAVGRGYRTNDEGIRQFRGLLGGAVDELIVVPLPHWRGPSDVFHLMSVLSPVDDRLAVVYSRLLPVPFHERLIDLDFRLVDVPDEEFDSMGANVLAIAPGQCVAVAGNPRTRARLEQSGVEVWVYEGAEISLKGGGGPTCLTRPICRDPVGKTAPDVVSK